MQFLSKKGLLVIFMVVPVFAGAAQSAPERSLVGKVWGLATIENVFNFYSAKSISSVPGQAVHKRRFCYEFGKIVLFNHLIENQNKRFKNSVALRLRGCAYDSKKYAKISFVKRWPMWFALTASGVVINSVVSGLLSRCADTVFGVKKIKKTVTLDDSRKAIGNHYAQLNAIRARLG